MKYLQKNKGFTLIEIIVALTVALIVFLAFSRVFIFGLRNERYIDNKLQAKNIANSIVEYIREDKTLLENDIEWKDIKIEFDDDEVNFIANPDENIKINSNYNSEENIYEVAIEIKWQERGNERSYSLQTLLSGD